MMRHYRIKPAKAISVIELFCQTRKSGGTKKGCVKVKVRHVHNDECMSDLIDSHTVNAQLHVKQD